MYYATSTTTIDKYNQDVQLHSFASMKDRTLWVKESSGNEIINYKDALKLAKDLYMKRHGWMDFMENWEYLESEAITHE